MNFFPIICEHVCVCKCAIESEWSLRMCVCICACVVQRQCFAHLKLLYSHFPPQGIRAVLAESYERIHRSNLVGMGVVPLQYLEGQSAASLGLTGRESYSVELPEKLNPGQVVDVKVCACVHACVCVIGTIHLCYTKWGSY